MSNARDGVRVGVRLGPPDDVTTWIADGAAFDAAGADALWLDLRDRPEFDPYVLTAALAAVTYRCELVLQPAADSGKTAADGTAAATLAAVSRDRLVLGVEEATTVDGEEGAGPAAYEQRDDAGGPRRWEATEYPADRAAWRAALAEAAGRGVHGLILPADPRLLDLLRNPDEEIDRRDLQLAAG